MRVHGRGGAGGGGTPTGWPLPFFTTSPNGSATTNAGANPANTVTLCGLKLEAQVQVSNISVYVGVTDAVNNCDMGLYNALGALLTHIGAQTLPNGTYQTFALVGAPVTINPGLLFFGFTSAGTTAELAFGSGQGIWGYTFVQNAGASVGGALPASVTPPAYGTAPLTYPYFVLH
jgi:hypothetical protein